VESKAYKKAAISHLPEMRRMRERGESLRSIAARFGISAPTVARYLAIPVQGSADTIDASPDALVEEALFKACVGYSADVVKNYKVKKVEYDSQTGKKISEHEEIVQARDSVHIPPSIMAQRFYLTSRMPEKWGGKALPDEVDEEAGVIVLPEISEEGEDG